jgi:hypothetical protein
MKSSLHKLSAAWRIQVIVLISIGLAAGEFLGQTFFGNPYNFFEHRYIYNTPNAFGNIERFWTYKPNASIEEMDIYRTSLGNFTNTKSR